MTVHVENWALCEDCGCPRTRMPDGKRCSRCLGTNLRKLIALENGRQDGGLMTLQDIARIIRPKHPNVTWISSIFQKRRHEFPNPIIAVAGGRALFDFDEVENWIYEYAARPRSTSSAVNKLMLEDLPPRPADPHFRREPAEEKLPTVEELCLDTRGGPC